MSDSFDSFKEASNFARDQAINNNEIYSVKRYGNEWVVTPKSKNYQSTSPQPKEPHEYWAKYPKKVRRLNNSFNSRSFNNLVQKISSEGELIIEEKYIGRGKEAAKKESKELEEKLKNKMGEEHLKARELERKISRNKVPINAISQPKKVSRYTICKLCQGNGGNCIKCGGSGYER